MIHTNYRDGTVARYYRCDGCNKDGVKLWLNGYHQFTNVRLFCAQCASLDTGIDISAMNAAGEILILSPTNEMYFLDRIGWYVPAIPYEDDNGYCVYGLAPESGIGWWKRLPNGRDEREKQQ